MVRVFVWGGGLSVHCVPHAATVRTTV
eukprot:COSAG02_NODE_29212_length_574_cov_0.570526_1_plen_26_part_10